MLGVGVLAVAAEHGRELLVGLGAEGTLGLEPEPGDPGPGVEGVLVVEGLVHEPVEQELARRRPAFAAESEGADPCRPEVERRVRRAVNVAPDEEPLDAGRGQRDPPRAMESVAQEDIAVNLDAVGGERDLAGVLELALLAAQVAVDRGSQEPDLTFGAEPLVQKRAPLDLHAVGHERFAFGREEGAARAVEVGANPGADQPDPASAPEPAAEEDAPFDLHAVGRDPAGVRARQVQGEDLGTLEVHSGRDGTVVEVDAEDDVRRLEIEPAVDAGPLDDDAAMGHELRRLGVGRQPRHPLGREHARRRPAVGAGRIVGGGLGGAVVAHHAGRRVLE